MVPGNDPKQPHGSNHARLSEQAAELVAAMKSGQSGPTAGRSTGPRKQSAPPGGMRVKALVIIFGIVVAAGLVLLGIRFLPVDKTIPDELVGVWRTEAPSHADRPFEVTKTNLIFHTGAADSVIYPVLRVRRVEGEGTTLYTIDYEVEGARFEFAFYYRVSPEESIQFRNQPQLEWRKQDST
jgi:hypothetical protein